MEQRSRSSTLYALLIGISYYLPNRLSNGSSYQSLSGCVRDIAQVEDFLRRMRGVPAERILKLTATNIGKPEPYEPHDRLPTYENMVVAFRRLTEMAQPGDQVYIHYSGHGGRTKTILPSIKRQGIDEALVPMNIGNSEARYLRDVEMAYMLQEMVKKGLIVTLVLDCCHSGGVTRGEEKKFAVRGLGTIDKTSRPLESLVASEEDLGRIWQNATGSSGWLPRPKGYVLLAACLSYEKAYECAFDGKQYSGVLTYWLLDSLKQIRPGFTYKYLHDIILAKVHGQFRRQTPQLEGDANRVVFDVEHIRGQYAITMMRTDMVNKRVLLNAGQVHPLSEGAQFALFPPGVSSSSAEIERLALASLSQLGATDSWATIMEHQHSDAIVEGSQAVLLDPGDSRLRSKVQILPQNSLPPTIDQNSALQRIVNALTQGRTGFIRLVSGNEPADYQITINKNGEYVIANRSGQIFNNLRSLLRINDPQAHLHVLDKLEHLTKYRNVQYISNPDSHSPLAGKLKVELLGKQRDYDPADPPKPQPFSIQGDTPQLRAGEWVFVRICNNYSSPINVSLLELQADWSITQFPLFGGDVYFMSFDPGQELVLPVPVDLPSGLRNGKEIIKIFGTLGTTSFRWLELPALAPTRVSTRGRLATFMQNMKEIILAAFEPGFDTEELSPAKHPSREWTVVQVEVLVHKALQ